MTIRIRRVGELYEADVTPPHGSGSEWHSTEPLPTDELIAALLALGCHQTDVGDAFYEADPEWLSRPAS